MNYQDWKDAHNRIDEERNIIHRLTCEQLAAIDIAQQISSKEFAIEMARDTLRRLKKAAKALPKPDQDMVENLSSYLIEEGKYKFVGKRELESQLYGFAELKKK